jgi:SP family myo-inositol transporter-like MFS transporter 13
MIVEPNSTSTEASRQNTYNILLMCVAGLGGLLYGVDIGIIGHRCGCAAR